MTVIRPNSISGITSLTALGSGIDFYNVNGVGIQFNNVNFNNTSGVSTFANIRVGSAVTLSSGGVSVTGVVTATSFSGSLTGNATGLSGTPNLNVGVVTATSFYGSGANLTNLNIPAGFNELDAALFS
jgi:hypothetical protein